MAIGYSFPNVLVNATLRSVENFSEFFSDLPEGLYMKFKKKITANIIDIRTNIDTKDIQIYLLLLITENKAN